MNSLSKTFNKDIVNLEKIIKLKKSYILYNYYKNLFFKFYNYTKIFNYKISIISFDDIIKLLCLYDRSSLIEILKLSNLIKISII